MNIIFWQLYCFWHISLEQFIIIYFVVCQFYERHFHLIKSLLQQNYNSRFDYIIYNGNGFWGRKLIKQMMQQASKYINQSNKPWPWNCTDNTRDNTCLVCFPFKNVVISLKPGVYSCSEGNEGTQLLHSISIFEWVQILCSVSRHLYNGKFVLVYLSVIFVCMYIVMAYFLCTLILSDG